MVIAVILGVPLFLAAAGMLIRNAAARGAVTCTGYGAVCAAAVALLARVLVSGRAITTAGWFFIDALGAFFIFVISVVVFAASLYSVGYIRKDVEKGTITPQKAGIYGVLFNLFAFSMFLVPAVNNVGILWVAIEMTTLISAFLVGFYNTKESVEAAWKYIIICSVGIIFALLGTILFSYALSLAGGPKTLDWTAMAAAAGKMDKNILKIAFIFILVGYGTKAGLAPMHTWLPDAHSQAVAPISALLSGVLLKTALYAILRFGIIVIQAVGFAYFGHLLLLFGLVSLLISCGFILVQKDLKRLLAYSSIEHIGIIAVGFGLGTPLAVAGALLHVFNHAVTKSFMFFGAGDIVCAYRTHTIKGIRGVIEEMPFTGIMMLLGVFALTGLPPFSIFASELLIIVAAFIKGSYLAAALVLVFLSVIFGAFIHYFGGMLFGKLPKGMAVKAEPLSGKLAFGFLLFQMCIAGVILVFVKKDITWISRTLFRI